MTDHTSPPSDGNKSDEGLTIWLTPHGDVTGTARAGLVRNVDGSTSVAIDTRAGMDRHSADDFADLVKSLGSVASLGKTLTASGVQQVTGVETAILVTNSKITVTPEVIEAVAEHLFDTGVETPMINNLRSIAACLRNDLDDPVEVAASVDPTSRSHALFSQLADAIEEENERKRVFHSAQRTQVVAAKRFEDASSAVQEIELQIRKLATGEQA